MKEKLKKIFKNRIIQIILFFIFVICLLLYGPYGGFRDWLITTSMTTMNHKWIAKMLYPERIIQNVLEQNRVQEIDENTDTSLINGTKANSNLENEILQKNNEDDVYKIIDIKELAYDFYLDDCCGKLSITSIADFIINNYLDNNITLKELQDADYADLYSAIDEDCVELIKEQEEDLER